MDASLKGYNIPKDTWIFPMVYAVTEDKKIWKDPEEFRPERFINDAGKFVRHESLIPFSVGEFLEHSV
jgi:cytochrome P450